MAGTAAEIVVPDLLDVGQRDVTRLAVWLVRLSRGASVLEMFQEVDDSAP